jgi:hypothetical protein
MLKDNPENRSSARFTRQSPITLENFEVGVMNAARMHNFSQSGLYFESDFYMHPGTEIYIGINDSPFSSQPGVYECYRSIIRWRKFLEDSFFDYGYGVEIKGRIDKRKSPGLSDRANSRRHLRKTCAVPTILQNEHGRMRGVIRNASHGGVFIRCAKKLTKGQRVFLTIPLQKKQKVVTRQGEVVWSNTVGVGIQFQTPSAES